MRNVILLHARSDAALAEELVSRNPRVALVCGIDRSAPPGHFGEQFHMAALWSREAALDGLEWVMAEALAHREQPSIIIVVDGVPVPACLARAGQQVRVSPMTDLAALFELLSPHVSAIVEDESDEDLLATRRRSVATAASAAFSIGCGALLAHAASPYGLIPTAATPTFTPTARTVVAQPVVQAEETLPVIEAVETRFESVRAPAASVASSPSIRARFERVKSIAISDMLLAQLAQRADEQAQTLFSAPPVAVAAVAAADVSTVRLASVTDTTPVKMAQSDLATFENSTF
ncbi:MAG: hypothetical protein KJS97_04730 [Alphaproteobacteria bacterium]|nr:hypothetical protein [Alphaproteobacteria bacterium]